ncbi:hypothetical protein HB662_01485 [Roseomonas frigidaquae]|uniref:Uncharacterized protein n=1 Tax=Falsiroseomonas frigidaquae TaxID=487318 RepID=A0ABX1ES46_9PROT|nr:hypothetical protein [Falsiroseomonas frigidaquae]NKE43431.1 hypothetical protein [Falsiroseomonas frigidaquae]
MRAGFFGTGLPPHIMLLARFRDAGGRIHLVLPGGRPPFDPPRPADLLILGDDSSEPVGSCGPDRFDGTRLRSWLAAMNAGRGAIGVFGGSPKEEAYGVLATGAMALPAGAVIIECGVGAWLDWSRFVFLHAPRAIRFDVIPASVEAEARRLIVAEGGQPFGLA